MKRVSFSVAKALKEAGYPQDWDNTNARYILKDFRIVTRWYREGEFLDDEDSTFGDCAIAPTYLEVWLWLWKEKKIAINLQLLSYPYVRWAFSIECVDTSCIESNVHDTQEEAIEQAIEYLIKTKTFE